ncbi:MAG: polysaccharide biosynthesis tyrosine autokinase [Dysgonamonadaceae bacterium]|jgi:capsular exopolysaccharide synthesis family protein|nr:polysaccharide biosynthesis tyrosine autokinase [Dysgonamonadaceae bacterium]
MESYKNKRESVKNSKKEVDFQWFFISFFIHWKWFLLSIILFLMWGFLRLRYSTPIYNVQAKIILKDSRRGGLNNSELSVFQSMGILQNNTSVENEIEILTSRNLAESVVIEQELFIRYVVKGKFKDTELYGNGNPKYYYTSPVKVFVDSSVISALGSTILLKVSTTDNHNILVEGNYGGNVFSGEYSFLPAVVATPIGELLLLGDETSTLRAEYPVEIQIIPPLSIAQWYLGMLSVSLTDNNTSVVRLSLNETNSQRGGDFLTKLINLYNSDTMADKDKAANSASRFIDERLSELGGELIHSEKEVQAYKQANDIADISYEADLVIGEKNVYEKMEREIESKLMMLSFLDDEFKKNEESSLLPITLGIIMDTPPLSTSLDQYNKLIQDKKRMLAYTDIETPIIKRIDERLSTLRENIRMNIESLRYSLEEQKKDYADLRKIYSEGIEEVPRKERELTEIVRQQMIKADLFVTLLSRKEEIALTLAVTAPSAKLLESPLSSGAPIAPRKMRLYMLCLLGGIVCPFVVIGIRELFNYKISNEEEVRRFSEVPVVVSLPMVKSKETLVISSHSTTAIAERFRLLRTNLQFLLGNPDKKVILVTSAISGEGKTFVSINLAMTFSLKYKTILVGLDIRRPKIGIYLDLPKEAGFISYLTGNNTDIDKLINKNIKGTELDVLIAGVVPPNPNELLMEKTLDDLFVLLRKKYDYIIIDTSPVGSVSDAFLVNRVSDVSLYIVRGNFSPKSSVTLINNIYDEKRLNDVNIVLNAFNNKKSGHYGYGYGGYGYGYGYGYGNYRNYGYGYTTE